MRDLYSYHKAEGIVAHECFSQERLTWENAEHLLPEVHAAKRSGVQTQGRFLQDGSGRRYPALLGLARKLGEASVSVQAHLQPLRVCNSD